MSALGNYVHYYKFNYNKWGTNLPNTSKSIDTQTSFSAFKETLTNTNQIKSYIEEAKYLEKRYNKLYYNKDTSALAIDFRKRLEKIMQDNLNKQYGAQAGNVSLIDLTVEETELYKKLSQAIADTQKQIKVLELTKETTVKQLLNSVDKLIMLLNNNNFKNISEIENHISYITSELQNIKSRFLNITPTELVFKNEYNNIETINSIIREFNRVPSLYDQNNKLFSWLLPFIGLNLSSIAKSTLKQEMIKIQDLFGGDITIELDDLSGVNITDIDISMEHINIKTISSLDETTVNITYTDKESLKTKKIIPINLIPDIQLVKDKSLYDILNLANINDFANHYLNVVTKAGRQASSSEQVLQANRLLKSFIVGLGADGNSDFIIINDSTKKEIKVYSVKAIILLLQEKIVTSNKFGSEINLGVQHTRIAHRWSPVSKEERIKKILDVTKKRKINAMLDSSNFKQYIKLING